MPDDDDKQRQEEGLRNLLQRHNNDWASLAGELFSENYRLRADRRDLKGKVSELEGKLPGEDAVVLTGKTKTEYEAYKALGKPEEISATLTSAKTAHREAAVAKLASAHGFKGSVLSRLLGDEAEILVEGTEDKPVYKVKNGDTTKSVEELLKAEWADFAPALAIAEKQVGTKAAGQAGGERDTGDRDYVADFLKAQMPEAKAS